MLDDGEAGKAEPGTDAWRTSFRGLFGAIVLGLLGSALYDFLFKPGLSAFGKGCLSMLTLGSSAVRDSVYAKATLDPTGIASLELLMIFWILYTILMGFACARAFRAIRPRGAIGAFGEPGKRLRASRPPLEEKAGRWLINNVRALMWFTIASSAILTVITTTELAMKAESLHIWRVFHRDLEVLAFAVSDSEFKMFRSRFARVRQRHQFQALRADMGASAKRGGVELEPLDTW